MNTADANPQETKPLTMVSGAQTFLHASLSYSGQMAESFRLFPLHDEVDVHKKNIETNLWTDNGRGRLAKNTQSWVVPTVWWYGRRRVDQAGKTALVWSCHKDGRGLDPKEGAGRKARRSERCKMVRNQMGWLCGLRCQTSGTRIGCMTAALARHRR